MSKCFSRMWRLRFEGKVNVWLQYSQALEFFFSFSCKLFLCLFKLALEANFLPQISHEYSWIDASWFLLLWYANAFALLTDLGQWLHLNFWDCCLCFVASCFSLAFLSFYFFKQVEHVLKSCQSILFTAFLYSSTLWFLLSNNSSGRNSNLQNLQSPWYTRWNIWWCNTSCMQSLQLLGIPA